MHQGQGVTAEGPQRENGGPQGFVFKGPCTMLYILASSICRTPAPIARSPGYERATLLFDRILSITDGLQLTKVWVHCTEQRDIFFLASRRVIDPRKSTPDLPVKLCLRDRAGACAGACAGA